MSSPAKKPLPTAAMTITRTSSRRPSASISAARANWASTPNAFTGGLQISNSAMPSATSILKGLVMVGAEGLEPPASSL